MTEQEIENNFPVRNGTVAFHRAGQRLVYIREMNWGANTATATVIWETKDGYEDRVFLISELETPEARAVREINFNKFVIGLAEEEHAPKGPSLVQ